MIPHRNSDLVETKEEKASTVQVLSDVRAGKRNDQRLSAIRWKSSAQSRYSRFCIYDLSCSVAKRETY